MPAPNKAQRIQMKRALACTTDLPGELSRPRQGYRVIAVSDSTNETVILTIAHAVHELEAIERAEQILPESEGWQIVDLCG